MSKLSAYCPMVVFFRLSTRADAGRVQWLCSLMMPRTASHLLLSLKADPKKERTILAQARLKVRPSSALRPLNPFASMREAMYAEITESQKSLSTMRSLRILTCGETASKAEDITVDQHDAKAKAPKSCFTIDPARSRDSTLRTGQ